LCRWRFFDYAEDIEEWYLALSEEAQDILNGLLKINSKTILPRDWIGCEMLQGACKEEGIWEWRFRADNIQQRLLGVFGQERGAAIFLIGCSHKQKVYKPTNCLQSAIKRAKDAKKGGPFRERKIRENL
jgi:hypothetical protein